MSAMTRGYFWSLCACYLSNVIDQTVKYLEICLSKYFCEIAYLESKKSSKLRL